MTGPQVLRPGPSAWAPSDLARPRLGGYHAPQAGVVPGGVHSDGDSPAGVRRQTPSTGWSGRPTEQSSHDDLAYVKDHKTDRVIAPLAPGWSSADRSGAPTPTVQPPLRDGPPPPPPLGRGCSAHPLARRPGVVRGDELADAKARQAQIKKDIAAQAAMVAKLTALQAELSQEISRPRPAPKGINADLAAVKVKITTMEGKIDVVQARLQRLVDKLQSLDAELVVIEAQEAAKRTELAVPQEAPRRAPAERLRHRSDVAPRDLPVGQHVHRHAHRDELLHRRRRAGQGARQRRSRRTRPRSPRSTRRPRTRAPRPNDLRQQTAAQKRALDKSLRELNAARPRSSSSRSATAAALASAEARRTPQIERNKAAAKAALAKAAAAQKKLKDQIAALIRKQLQGGNIPSAYNGTLTLADERRRDPELRLHRVLVGAAARVVRPLPPAASTSSPRTARRSGHRATGPSSTSAGTTPTAPTRPGSSSSPTATRSRRGTPTCSRATRAGSTPAARSTRGQLIGYEGNTGHSTGAHLHWAVMFNGELRQPASVPVGRGAAPARSRDVCTVRQRVNVPLMRATSVPC